MHLISSCIVDRLPLTTQDACAMPHRIVPTHGSRPPKKRLKYQSEKTKNNPVSKHGRRNTVEGSDPPPVFGIISDAEGLQPKQFQLEEASNVTHASTTQYSLAGLQLRRVKDMYFHPHIADQSTDQDLEKSLSTCRKNRNALKSLLSFLDPSSNFSTINNSSIFERFLFGASPHVNAFGSASFSVPDIGPKDTQYLHIRGSPPAIPLSSYKSISIITSICLFSAEVVSSLSSKLIDQYTRYGYSGSLPLDHPLTLNELDSLSRLSNTIADVICTISSSSSSHSSSPLSVNIILDIPQIQYYLSGPTSHFHIPVISNAWLSLVNSRKAAIERIFKICITQEIHRRIPVEKFKLSGVSYKITNTSSLKPLLPLINSQIGDFPSISVHPCIDTLSSADEAWKLFLESLPLPGLQPPETLEQLVFISYVYEILLPFLRTLASEGAVENMDDTLMLQIDNIVESKPYLKAKKFLEVYNKKIGTKKATLIGIYPSERIFYSKEGSYRSSLHKYDPGVDLYSDSQRVALKDVLETVYGIESTATVVEAAMEESLL